MVLSRYKTAEIITFGPFLNHVAFDCILINFTEQRFLAKGRQIMLGLISVIAHLARQNISLENWKSFTLVKQFNDPVSFNKDANFE